MRFCYARECHGEICHSKTRDLPEVVRRADIVVAAMGKAGYVQPDWIRRAPRD